MIKIQRLNMDNSWYIGLDHLHILVDPWLHGNEVDFFSWFNTQWHRTAPIPYEKVPEFDVILITQKYPDHFHPDTLLKLRPKTILGPKSIESKVKKILPDVRFYAFDKSMRIHEMNGVKFHFLPTTRWIDPIYDAFIIDDGKEAICLATHGFSLDKKHLEQIQNVSEMKLLMTPFNYYQLPGFLGGLVSPGLNGVKHLYERLHPHVIVPTHDEDKHAKGIVTKLAKVIRSMSTEDLRKLDWLKHTYQPMDHYEIKELS